VNFKVFIRNSGATAADSPRVTLDFGTLASLVEGSSTLLANRGGQDTNTPMSSDKVLKYGTKISWTVPRLGPGGGVYVLFQARLASAATFGTGVFGLNYRAESSLGTGSTRTNNVVVVVSSPK
jgi:hypothetical protein